MSLIHEDSLKLGKYIKETSILKADDPDYRTLNLGKYRQECAFVQNNVPNLIAIHKKLNHAKKDISFHDMQLNKLNLI